MSWVQNLMVGVLFFGALALVGFFTIVSDFGPFALPGKQMVVFFDNAEGLKIGSRVTVLGVPSGLISDIALVPVDVARKPVNEDSPLKVAQRVAVTIELKKPVYFYKNYSIAIKNESILAGKVVAIDPGNAGVGDVERLELFSISARDVSRNKTALKMRLENPDIKNDLEGISSGDPLAGVSELIEENREDVRRTINNVAEITTKINTGRGTLGLLVNDDELHRNANTVLTDAEIVVRELREGLEDTREQAPVTSFIRSALTAF